MSASASFNSGWIGSTGFPRKWYVSFDVEKRRDVIEYPIVDEIDCGGWDLRKALYLFTRTNGAPSLGIRVTATEDGNAVEISGGSAPLTFPRPRNRPRRWLSRR